MVGHQRQTMLHLVHQYTVAYTITGEPAGQTKNTDGQAERREPLVETATKGPSQAFQIEHLKCQCCIWVLSKNSRGQDGQGSNQQLISGKAGHLRENRKTNAGYMFEPE